LVVLAAAHRSRAARGGSVLKTLIVERADSGIVTVTLNRPEKKNAINGPMWAELLETFESLQHDEAARVLVLTGTGGAFCSGADLSDEDTAQRHQLDRMHYFAQMALALHHLPIPAIAKIAGIAAGAGLNLALGCDLVVASDRARFSEIFHKRGLSIDLGGSWLLPRLVGLHRAKELAFFADVVTAAEAERLGLVNHVVPHASLDEFVDDWAARLCEAPPLAIHMTKRLLNNSYSMSLDEALQYEGMAQSVNIASDDVREAFGAFFAKRAPRFKGR
jgi:2-(1,2-epoxy-1,2-dihydrophenyl)acetyl-CoA isomerase